MCFHVQIKLLRVTVSSAQVRSVPATTCAKYTIYRARPQFVKLSEMLRDGWMGGWMYGWMDGDDGCSLLCLLFGRGWVLPRRTASNAAMIFFGSLCVFWFVVDLRQSRIFFSCRPQWLLSLSTTSSNITIKIRQSASHENFISPFFHF